MTIAEKPTEQHSTAAEPWSSSRLTKWSWVMVPGFLFLWGLSGTVYFRLLEGPLGIHEGDVILMARSASGWAAEIGSVLAGLAAPVLGVLLGVRAIRRGGRWGSWTAVIVNAGFALLVLYMFVDDIHMTYFPSWSG